MSTKQPDPREEPQPLGDQDDDTEGHWISPTLSRDLARDRERQLQREAREHQRAKEAKGR